MEHFENELRVSDINEVRIRQLIKSQTSVSLAIKNAERELDRLTRHVANLQQQIDKMPPLTQRQSLTELAAIGDPVAEVAILERTVGIEETQIIADLRRLGTSHDWPSAPAVPVPSIESIRHHDQRRKDIDKAIESADRERKRVRDMLRSVDGTLRELEQEGPVPLPQERIESRETRDRSWTMIRSVWLDGAAPPIPPIRLANEYEQTVRTSDDVSDALMNNAKRVGQKAVKSEERAKLSSELCDRETDFQALENESKHRDGEWHSLWAASGTDAKRPADMISWSQEWTTVCGKVIKLLESQTQLATLKGKRDRFLAAVSKELGVPLPSDEHAADRVKTRLTELQALEGQRTQLNRDLQNGEEQRHLAKAIVDDAKTAWEIWQRNWRDAVVFRLS